MSTKFRSDRVVLFHPRREKNERTLATEIRHFIDYQAKNYGAHIGKCIIDRKWSDPPEYASLITLTKQSGSSAKRNSIMLERYKIMLKHHLEDERVQRERWQKVFFTIKLAMTSTLYEEVQRHKLYKKLESDQDPGGLFTLIESVAGGDNKTGERRHSAYRCDHQSPEFPSTTRDERPEIYPRARSTLQLSQEARSCDLQVR